jgi:hypothetical protein
MEELLFTFVDQLVRLWALRTFALALWCLALGKGAATAFGQLGSSIANLSAHHLPEKYQRYLFAATIGSTMVLASATGAVLGALAGLGPKPILWLFWAGFGMVIGALSIRSRPKPVVVEEDFQDSLFRVWLWQHFGIDMKPVLAMLAGPGLGLLSGGLGGALIADWQDYSLPKAVAFGALCGMVLGLVGGYIVGNRGNVMGGLAGMLTGAVAGFFAGELVRQGGLALGEWASGALTGAFGGAAAGWWQWKRPGNEAWLATLKATIPQGLGARSAEEETVHHVAMQMTHVGPTGNGEMEDVFLPVDTRASGDRPPLGSP